MNEPKTRPWEWTPPPAMNRVMMTILRLPVLHRMMSGGILLLTYTGRKSGKRYTTPIGYLQEGQTVTLMCKSFRTWWRNFQQPAPVTLHIAGRDYTGQAQAFTDPDVITPLMARAMQSNPRQAEPYGVRLGVDGSPNIDDLRSIAPKMVVVQVTLDSM